MKNLLQTTILKINLTYENINNLIDEIKTKGTINIKYWSYEDIADYNKYDSDLNKKQQQLKINLKAIKNMLQKQKNILRIILKLKIYHLSFNINTLLPLKSIGLSMYFLSSPPVLIKKPPSSMRPV